MKMGATSISVTTPDGTSNSIDFYCRVIGNNHIYFVASNGSDSNNGLADVSQGSGVGPWATPAKARGSVQTGDIAYFRGGLYTTVDTWDAVVDLWSNNHANREMNKGIAIASYPAENA